MKNGRYPLNLKHISGDEEVVSLKAQNLNPFYKQSEEEEWSSKRRQAFANYGNPIRGNRACVPEGHGRMLKNCITCLKVSSQGICCTKLFTIFSTHKSHANIQ